MEIQYHNRHTNEIEVEKVYGDSAVKWLYNSSSGRLISSALVKAPVSVMYGFFQDLPFSRFKIEEFVKNYKIPMDDYLPEEGASESKPYSSFNQFFIRRFKDGLRDFIADDQKMGAFAEARYFGYESIKDDQRIPVKGKYLNAKELLGNDRWTDTFHDGPLLLARLCPVDYHRFHYPDDGEVVDYYKVDGGYHSVNPIALKAKSDIFSTNIREVTVLETKNFGKLAYVEVGAIMVGKIVQSGNLDTFKKGDEKGYFLFGGSTVIVIGEKGKWIPSQDIVQNTQKGIETYLHLGTEVGLKP